MNIEERIQNLEHQITTEADDGSGMTTVGVKEIVIELRHIMSDISTLKEEVEELKEQINPEVGLI